MRPLCELIEQEERLAYSRRKDFHSISLAADHARDEGNYQRLNKRPEMHHFRAVQQLW